VKRILVSCRVSSCGRSRNLSACHGGRACRCGGAIARTPFPDHEGLVGSKPWLDISTDFLPTRVAFEGIADEVSTPVSNVFAIRFRRRRPRPAELPS